MFDAISTLAVSTTPAELYRTVLVDTPLGAPLGLGLGLGLGSGSGSGSGLGRGVQHRGRGGAVEQRFEHPDGLGLLLSI